MGFDLMAAIVLFLVIVGILCFVFQSINGE